jgi:hypothetical protein
MRKTVTLLLFLLVFVSQLKASPPIGAVVQSWHYDLQTRMLTVVIANTSGKDITAYNMSINETFADHSVTSHEHLVDMLSAVMLVQRAKGTPDEDRIQRKFGNGTLAAYQTRDELFGPCDEAVTDFQATIDVVAYADGTAEATNAPALDRLREHRNAELRSYQKAKQIINEVLADSTIQNPAEEAAARLRKFLTDWSAQPHYSVDIERGVIEAVIRDLNGAPRIIAGRHLSGEPEFLQQYLEEKDQYMSLVSKHAQLKGRPMKTLKALLVATISFLCVRTANAQAQCSTPGAIRNVRNRSVVYLTRTIFGRRG